MNRSLVISMLCIASSVGTNSAFAVLAPLPQSSFGLLTLLAHTPAVARLSEGAAVLAAIGKEAIMRRIIQPVLDEAVCTGVALGAHVAVTTRQQVDNAVERIAQQGEQVIETAGKAVEREVENCGNCLGDLVERSLERTGLIPPKVSLWERYRVQAASFVTGGIAAALIYRCLRPATNKNKKPAVEEDKASSHAQVA